ncbi:MAG: ClpXP protease specificity-enhancing factor SspB [Pseudomonadota bacterium]
MNDDVELDYNDLIQEAQKKAYRFLMRDVLSIIAELGDAPGEHHFFIEFITDAPGVAIPDHLKEQYPERMTIVLQHQFENLTVSDDQMGVTLWFKGKEARLEIPFDAVTQFADPSAQFGVNFDIAAEDIADATEENSDRSDQPEPEDDSAKAPQTTETDAENNEGADIVSLDSFRKK